MTESRRIYIDTSPYIYYLEAIVPHRENNKKLLDDL